MSERVPSWLEKPRQSKLPDWLTVHSGNEPASPLTLRGASPEGRKVLIAQFEMIFPRILEMVCAGSTLNNAIKELPIVVDVGAFIRWLKKQPQLYEMYKEAKEVRTEAWAGKIIAHAEGEAEGFANDTARSKLIVDTYKWLMGADNRKQYGDTKTIEMNTSISITTALAQAHGRVIEAQVIDDDAIETLSAKDYKMLPEASDDWDEDE